MAENLFAAGNVHLVKHVNALKGRLHGMNSLSIREMGIVYYGVGEQVLNYGSRFDDRGRDKEQSSHRIEPVDHEQVEHPFNINLDPFIWWSRKELSHHPSDKSSLPT
ncbi:hypothetical protein CEXT_121681 [Caerostris extrusa]|uniref:Uncharacterized protein n=1 Tax=Caerostris extrusa TaxID=172846 RepID=A0AAV4N7U4_CAEEX|nr:hypothetical protein CEXT_121681 [Caerostris extrusa]